MVINVLHRMTVAQYDQTHSKVRTVPPKYGSYSSNPIRFETLVRL